MVQTTDPAKTKQALTKLSGLLPQITTGLKVSPLSGVAGADDGFQIESPSLPFPIIAAVGGDKFVLGIGAQTVEAALSPSSTLGDSAAYKTAAAALGETKPAFFLDVGAVSALIGGLVPTETRTSVRSSRPSTRSRRSPRAPRARARRSSRPWWSP